MVCACSDPKLTHCPFVTIWLNMAAFSRRWLLKVVAAAGGLSAPTRFSFMNFSSTNILKQADDLGATTKLKTKPHIAVIGAGAFGGWTALYLLRQGARVTLLDAWGPGNSRASSGGETRVIRATYGSRAVYTRMAARALALWKEHQKHWHRQLYRRIGMLWLVESDE